MYRPSFPKEHSGDSKLVAIYQETRAAIEAGRYTRSSDNRAVSLKPAGKSEALRSAQNGDLVRLGAGLNTQDPKNRIRKPSSTKPQIAKPIITTTEVLNSDSFAAAKKLIDQGYNPLVLNMANKTSIGGGVATGAKAQEEDLCRCSDYTASLYPLGAQSADGRYYYAHPISEFGCIYTDKVQVFRDRDNGYAFLEQPFSVSCIAVAGYDLGKPNMTKELEGTNLLKAIQQGQSSLDAFERWTQEKIKLILEVAIMKGHDSLVLGVLSCGAFRYRDPATGQQEDAGITAERVARAFETVLKQPEYQGRFKNITFAILGTPGVGQKNVEKFSAMCQGLIRALPTAYSGSQDLKVKAEVPPISQMSEEEQVRFILRQSMLDAPPTSVKQKQSDIDTDYLAAIQASLADAEEHKVKNEVNELQKPLSDINAFTKQMRQLTQSLEHKPLDPQASKSLRDEIRLLQDALGDLDVLLQYAPPKPKVKP